MHEKIKNITNIKSKRKEYEKKLNPKITVIVHGILGILDYYDKYDEDQKSFLHTRIAAELYYLPDNIIFNYSGRATKKALEFREEKKNVTRDHYNVRKICGKNAIYTIKEEVKNSKSEKEVVDVITNKFIDVYGKYNHTTSCENQKLKNHQIEANFSSSDEAYEKADVTLLDDDKWIKHTLKINK